jgi:hypothetical protein
LTWARTISAEDLPEIPPIESFEIQLGPLPGYAVVAYAKIIDAVLPGERFGKYEEPLERALARRKLRVITGGTMPDAPLP